MGFNYWALLATNWSLNLFNINRVCCFGRQVIHVHDYDREGKELIDQGLIDYLPALGSNILPYADLKYFKDRNIVVDSLDCSEYESANIIADLSIPYNFNKAIQQRKGNYNAVFDIGTSEHVGNTFASIENALMLLDEGGYYFYDLPYANWMNHGLIQFCPSFFSELCRTNGFEMVFNLYILPAGKVIWFL